MLKSFGNSLPMGSPVREKLTAFIVAITFGETRTMQLPLQITFRHVKPSAAVEARIRQEAAKLEKFCEKIMSCRVIVEAPHRHHNQGNLFHVRIDLAVPQEELVVSREHHDERAHEDAYVVIRDAFNALHRQLEDYVRRRRGDVKFRANQVGLMPGG